MAVIRDVMPAFELFQPTSIDGRAETCSQQLRQGRVGNGRRPRQLRLAQGSHQEAQGGGGPERSQELKGVRITADGIEIGAMTTLTEVVQQPVIKEKYSLLAEGAEAAASPQIRNQGTIGGNVSQDARCWYYRAAGRATVPAETSATPTRPTAAIASTPFCMPIAAWR